MKQWIYSKLCYALLSFLFNSCLILICFLKGSENRSWGNNKCKSHACHFWIRKHLTLLESLYFRLPHLLKFWMESHSKVLFWCLTIYMPSSHNSIVMHVGMKLWDLMWQFQAFREPSAYNAEISCCFLTNGCQMWTRNLPNDFHPVDDLIQTEALMDVTNESETCTLTVSNICTSLLPYDPLYTVHHTIAFLNGLTVYNAPCVRL